MRWCVLYARSRRVPSSAAALVITAVLAWLADDHWIESPELRVAMVALAITLSVGAAVIGLGGTDPDLERTAAFAWPLRRAAHVTLIAVAVAVALGVTRQVPTGLVLRDTAGLVGAGALGAVLFSARVGWSVPVVLTALAVATPLEQVQWLIRPDTTTGATVTSIVLGVAGALAYTVLGSRRT
jgi:hypothetical protein